MISRLWTKEIKIITLLTGISFDSSLELRCSSQFGFYFPLFIASGLTISVTLALNVNNLLKFGAEIEKEKQFKNGLKTINKSLVTQVQQQGYSERDAQIAVLQTKNTTFEAALHAAVQNDEKKISPK